MFAAFFRAFRAPKLTVLASTSIRSFSLGRVKFNRSETLSQAAIGTTPVSESKPVSASVPQKSHGSKLWEQRLEREAENPELRERRHASQASWRERMRNDPCAVQKMREYDKARFARKYQDPIYREYWRDRKYEIGSRLMLDPLHRRKQNERSKAWRQKRIQDDQSMARQRFQVWMYKEWVQQTFTWKTHEPVRYPAKVNHCCTDCHSTKRRGLMLWWREKKNPETYLCHACFASDSDRAKPIELQDWDFSKGRTPQKKSFFRASHKP